MTNAPLRVLFAGTPEFAAVHLARLLDSEHQLIGVYTQPDRPAGRGRKLQASPVKQLAESAGLPVYQPVSLKDAATQQQLAALAADVLVVVAYGLILPQSVLDTPRFGCLNVHASLLPRWRGAAPIQRAIEAGDTHTGITIMQMDAGLDTGAMLATASCPIGTRTNAGELQDQLAALGPPLLLDVLGDLAGYQRRSSAQDDAQANYAHKILKPEAQLDWLCSANALERRVRAFNPFPVCYSLLGGERIRVWQATSPRSPATLTTAPGTIVRAESAGIEVCCGAGTLTLEVLQLEGGRALTVEDMLRAHQAKFEPGRRFDLPGASTG
jgi:methionyl-tRNA formyltransferase